MFSFNNHVLLLLGDSCLLRRLVEGRSGFEDHQQDGHFIRKISMTQRLLLLHLALVNLQGPVEMRWDGSCKWRSEILADKKNK